MPLDRQNLNISFGNGVDTKTDPKQVVLAKVLSLVNATFGRLLSFKKRNGYNGLSQNIISGGSISNGVGTASFQNQLVEWDGSKFYSFNEQTQNWSTKNSFVTNNLFSQTIVSNTNNQTSQDSALNTNIIMYAWEDSSGGVRYSVIDSVTFNPIVDNQLLLATAFNPRVAAIGSLLVVFYVDSGTNQIKYQSVNVATPGTISAATTATSDLLSTNEIFDIATIGSQLFLVYNKNPNGIAIYPFSSTLVQGSQVTIGTDTSTSVNIFGDGSNNVWVSYYDGSNVKVFIETNGLTSVLAPTIVETVSNIRNVTGSVVGSTGNIFYEVSAALAFNNNIRINTITSSGTVGTPQVLIRSLGLASKSFVYSSVSYIVATYPSSIEGKYFIISQSGQAISRIGGEPNIGGGLTAKSLLPSINQVSSDTFNFSYLFQDSTVFSQSLTLIPQLGIVQGTIELNTNTTYSNVTLGNNLSITGGMPSIYDGNSLVEQGFNVYPENLTSTTLTSGGTLSLGQYQYSSTYEWTDNEGQTHRSAPSIPLTVKNVTSQVLGQVGVGAATWTPNVTSSFGSLYPGMLMSGADILPGTYAADFETIHFSFALIMSANATGSSSSEFTTFTPAVTTGINVLNQNVNLNTVQVQQLKYIPIVANFVNSSTSVTVVDATFLRVGMTLNNVDSFINDGNNVALCMGTITAISGNTLTLNNPAQKTGTNVQCFASAQFTANATMGSKNVTGVPAAFQAILATNDRVYTGFIGDTTIAGGTDLITYTSGSTFQLQTKPSTITAAVTFYLGFDIRAGIRVGQSVSGTGITGTPLVTKVTGGVENGSGGSSIVLSSQSVNVPFSGSTTADSTFFFQNTFQEFIVVPTLRVTSKPNPVNVVLYRTQVNLPVFYRIASQKNDPTIDCLTFNDQAPDSAITVNPVLYTSGGVVENFPVPPHNAIVTYKSREIVIPVENPLSWWYSLQVVPGSPVEFSESNIQNIDEFGGFTKALGVLDANLIFFKPNAIFLVAGEGPAPNGTNNDFTSPQLITTDTGCNNPKSVVQTPLGLMFQSPKGFYLLNRGLQTQYIGRDVEFYNNIPATSAQLIPGVNQVRFTLNNGTVLQYEYLQNQWDVFNNISAVDSCLFQNQFLYLNPNGQAFQETPGTFSDNGSYIPMSVTTSWIQTAGIQGFQRVYKVYVFGDWKSSHNLTISLAYNFDPTIVQTDTIPVTSSVVPYQFRINTQFQKCQALQVTISDSQNGSVGEGFELSTIGLEVGVKKGLFKVPATKAFG